MPLQKKLLPRPSFSLVLHPEGDRDYRHFEGAGEVPFENGASTMSRANAWWLADSSLLAVPGTRRRPGRDSPMRPVSGAG